MAIKTSSDFKITCAIINLHALIENCDASHNKWRMNNYMMQERTIMFRCYLYARPPRSGSTRVYMASLAIFSPALYVDIDEKRQ